MPHLARPLSRRTTLAAAPLGVLSVALAGCRWGPEEEAPAQVEGPSEAPADAQDDTTYATEALAAVTGVAAVVAAVAARQPGLASPLADLTALHEAHAALLQEAADEPTAPETPAVPTGNRQALALVRREERRLQRRLGDLADLVASGPFARALASMSAGVAQQLAVLPGAGAVRP